MSKPIEPIDWEKEAPVITQIEFGVLGSRFIWGPKQIKKALHSKRDEITEVFRSCSHALHPECLADDILKILGVEDG